ncbi:MAG: cytochrome c family protein [Alphaproteobacteria bacterium]|nr:cytochrome c family protein [Alphaproteobacteria bacterium]
MIRLIAVCVALFSAGRALAADLEAGKAAFQKCRMCHSLDFGAGTRVGPSLHGVFGRKAGTFDDFPFSETMKNSGVVWSEDTLGRYIRDPKGFLPGNRMAFPGIKSDRELEDLLAYLRQATQ